MPRSTLFVVTILTTAPPLQASPEFFSKHCTDCHDQQSAKAGLDLESLLPAFTDPATVDT